MLIIIKFIIRNIKEKKFRTFLMIFSIMLSSALFFSSNAISDTSLKMFTDRMKQYYGTSEIVLHAGEKSPSSFFSMNQLAPFADRLEYAVGSVQSSATYKHSDEETITLQLNSFDLEDLKAMNPIAVFQEHDLYPFEGKKIILSSATAEKYGLKAGDPLELKIGNVKHHFTISGISHPTGMFLDETQTTYGIVPKETLSTLFNAKGRVGVVYAKLKDPSLKQQTLKDLSEVYNKYTVREPFSREEAESGTRSMATTFMLMTLIVTIMSVFIIYTSFKVVTIERLPIIGTFRSVGATKRMTSTILLAESVVYGIIGGALGCVLGLGILYIMAILTKPVWMKGFVATIQFTPVQLASAFLLAVLLSLISCTLPIVKVSGIPVKDIVLNAIQRVKKKRPWKLVLGIVLLILAIAGPAFAPSSLGFITGTAGMLLSIIAVIQLVPYITQLAVYMLEKVYTLIFGNIGVLAAKNLRENKSILNNITLLAIGISSLLMINTISFSVVKEVTNFYRNADFDTWINYAWQADRNFEHMLQKVEGVSGVYGIYETHGIQVEGSSNHQLGLIQGIDKTKYLQYWNMDILGDRVAELEELDGGRNIIVGTNVREKLNLKEGDILTLRMKNGSRDYKVTGFVSTVFYNGNYAIIPERYFKMDTGEKYFTNVYVKTDSDAQKVTDTIKKDFSRKYVEIRTVEEMENLNRQSNDSIFVILQGFSILALIIGVFGVLNNLIISFIERKRSLAMLRSVGMSKDQVVRMIFIEAMTGGFVGGFIGLVGGFLLVWGVPYVLKAMDMNIPMGLPYDSLIWYVLAGMLTTVLASIAPAVKTSGLNLIESVKYE